MGEPNTVLRRLLELEERVRMLEISSTGGAVETDEVRQSASMAQTILDEFVMPALLVLAGQGYRDILGELLERVEVYLPGMPGFRDEPEVPTFVRDWLSQWRRAIDQVPEWRPPDMHERWLDHDRAQQETPQE